MLALVLGNASVAPGFTDWCCQCCRTTFSKKADLRRHWRRPIPCEADGCRKSFRYDKFRSYRHHHRDKHSTDGVPLFDAGQLRNWFKRQWIPVTWRAMFANGCPGKRDEFKNVIDPIYCSGQTYHGLGVDSLVNNVMSNHEYGDTNGIEALPHPQSEPQGRLGDGGDSHTDGSSLSTAVPLDNRSSPFISTINTHQATLNHGQQTHWDRNTALTTNPQNWGMDFGFDSGTRPMRPADPGERERLLAEVCV
jgi:hypothetical protein